MNECSLCGIDEAEHKGGLHHPFVVTGCEHNWREPVMYYNETNLKHPSLKYVDSMYHPDDRATLWCEKCGALRYNGEILAPLA